MIQMSQQHQFDDVVAVPIDKAGVENIPEHGEEDWSLEKAVVAPSHVWDTSEDENASSAWRALNLAGTRVNKAMKTIRSQRAQRP